MIPLCHRKWTSGSSCRFAYSELDYDTTDFWCLVAYPQPWPDLISQVDDSPFSYYFLSKNRPTFLKVKKVLETLNSYSVISIPDRLYLCRRKIDAEIHLVRWFPQLQVGKVIKRKWCQYIPRVPKLHHPRLLSKMKRKYQNLHHRSKTTTQN